MNSQDKDLLDSLWKRKEEQADKISRLEDRVCFLEHRLNFPPKHKIGDVIEEGTVLSMKIAYPIYDDKGVKIQRDWEFEVLTKEGRKISVSK